jgi:hypothetical protein
VEEGEAEGVYTDRREDGVALFLHASYFNHSCTYVIVRARACGVCACACVLLLAPKAECGPMQQAWRQARGLHRVRRHQER